MSHTVTIDVKMKNKQAVIRVAKQMNARILGEGQHRLFSSSHTGLAFHLPNWSYPMVVDEAGDVFFDNYGGRWGDMADVEKLKDSYALFAAQEECNNLGWYSELNESTGTLIINHPSGGTITVERGGKIDANNFSGGACAEATLKLEQAMGNRLGEIVKGEMNDVQLNQQVRED